MSIFLAELIGTMILILLGDGVVANVLLNKSKGQNSGWIVITAGWGFAVAVAVYTVGFISGGHINPAVTIGFAVVNPILWPLVPAYLAGQFIGAFLGAVLVWLAYLPHWAETESTGLKLAVYSTAPAIRNYGLNLLTEIIGTFMLMVGVLGIFNVKNAIGAGVGPYAVGILVLPLACPWADQPAMPSIQPVILAPGLRTSSCRLPGRATRTGVIPGYRWLARSLALSLARLYTKRFLELWAFLGYSKRLS
jgi:glycerol uptake facilitator protein